MNTARFSGCIVIAILLIAHPQTADAGRYITFEAISYSDETETPQIVNQQKHHLQVDKGRFRTKGGDPNGFDLIADIDSGRIYVLDATVKKYAIIPFPDRRDTQDDEGVFRVEVVDTGPKLLGYATRVYRIFEDSTLIRELLTTERFGLGFDYMFAMEGLEYAFQEFAPAEDFADLQSLFRKVSGIPLKDVQYYPYGKDVMQATRIEQRSFGPEDFLPPVDYSETPLRELAEGGASEEDAEKLPSAGP